MHMNLPYASVGFGMIEAGVLNGTASTVEVVGWPIEAGRFSSTTEGVCVWLVWF
jgi:hypothetical protein